MVRFVDSNIFIYHIDRNPRFGEITREILLRIEKGEEAVTSTLVLEEVFVHMEQEYSVKDIPIVLYSIVSYASLRIVPYEVGDMLRAVEILGEVNYDMDWTMQSSSPLWSGTRSRISIQTILTSTEFHG